MCAPAESSSQEKCRSPEAFPSHSVSNSAETHPRHLADFESADAQQQPESGACPIRPEAIRIPLQTPRQHEDQATGWIESFRVRLSKSLYNAECSQLSRLLPVPES
jgi:hypothetical protein